MIRRLGTARKEGLRAGHVGSLVAPLLGNNRCWRSCALRCSNRSGVGAISKESKGPRLGLLGEGLGTVKGIALVILELRKA